MDNQDNNHVVRDYLAPASNREFIEALKKSGDCVQIDQEVDWDNEAGAIVRRCCELEAPSPYMTKIKDYPGFSFMGAPLSTYRRMAISLGMDPESTLPEISKEYLARTNSEPIESVTISKDKAPCKENILTGDDVDLCKLPIPLVHEGDGGRYVGTWHAVITKHPESGDVNWGMYRQMMYDGRTMSGAVFPFSDLGKTLSGYYLPRGEAMPFATAIGLSPLAAMAACAPSPIPEDQLTGMLAGKPVELVKCETNDLEVPANAEIILEGEIVPDVQVEEGPFGEYTGYRTSPRDFRVTFRVNCITYRNNATMTISNMGVPQDEGQLLRSFSLGLELEKLLRSQGIPITGVYMHPRSTHHMMIVGVKPTYAGIASQIAQLAFGSKLGPWFHMVMVVDDTIDIYNWDQVYHAFCTRVNPVRDIRVYDHSTGTPLYPHASPHERKWSMGSKVVFDCTWPVDWDPINEVPTLVSFDAVYPQAIKDKVLSNWESYGFDAV
ncbi:MAG: phenylphosphate carboxylase subunit alpha [Rhodospirillales bacterium]|nr:phenylphosphate carboxylase subunit alpha [Rhodospirillales bacterium]